MAKNNIDTTPSTVAMSALQALPFGTIIGGPLQACVEAQTNAAQATWKFIRDVGLTEGENGEKKATYVSFVYRKNGRDATLNVPLLTIVPIPYLAIRDIDIAFFLVSVLINSQGAVVVAMLPLAYTLNIEGWILLGVLPSVYGYFFIPNYPSDIATVNFDRSGTTVIGKYLLNHSFMMPGLISVITSTIIAYVLSYICHSAGMF